MKNRFDLEQEIMDCWRIVDDISVVCHAQNDELADVLLGIKILYQLKFERLFRTFEDCVRREQI